MNTYTPFVYLIGWSRLDRWYYGVRYAKGCHPNDLWTKYFTSSKIVAKIREDHGEPDVIQIRHVFETEHSAIKWENCVLRRMKVTKSPRWINQCDGRAVSSEILVNSFVVMDKDTKKIIGRVDKNHHNILSGQWISVFRGQKRPKAKNVVWWNNGSDERRSLISPGEDWLLGRIFKHRRPSSVPKEQMQCEHCRKIIPKNIYAVFHGEKCHIVFERPKVQRSPYWNNGKEEKRSFENPGEGWLPGKLIGKRKKKRSQLSLNILTSISSSGRDK